MAAEFASPDRDRARAGIAGAADSYCGTIGLDWHRPYGGQNERDGGGEEE